MLSYSWLSIILLFDGFPSLSASKQQDLKLSQLTKASTFALGSIEHLTEAVRAQDNFASGYFVSLCHMVVREWDFLEKSRDPLRTFIRKNKSVATALATAGNVQQALALFLQGFIELMFTGNCRGSVVGPLRLNNQPANHQYVLVGRTKLQVNEELELVNLPNGLGFFPDEIKTKTGKTFQPATFIIVDGRGNLIAHSLKSTGQVLRLDVSAGNLQSFPLEKLRDYLARIGNPFVFLFYDELAQTMPAAREFADTWKAQQKTADTYAFDSVEDASIAIILVLARLFFFIPELPHKIMMHGSDDADSSLSRQMSLLMAQLGDIPPFNLNPPTTEQKELISALLDRIKQLSAGVYQGVNQISHYVSGFLTLMLPGHALIDSKGEVLLRRALIPSIQTTAISYLDGLVEAAANDMNIPNGSLVFADPPQNRAKILMVESVRSTNDEKPIHPKKLLLYGSYYLVAMIALVPGSEAGKFTEVAIVHRNRGISKIGPQSIGSQDWYVFHGFLKSLSYKDVVDRYGEYIKLHFYVKSDLATARQSATLPSLQQLVQETLKGAKAPTEPKKFVGIFDSTREEPSSKTGAGLEKKSADVSPSIVSSAFVPVSSDTSLLVPLLINLFNIRTFTQTVFDAFSSTSPSEEDILYNSALVFARMATGKVVDLESWLLPALRPADIVHNIVPLLDFLVGISLPSASSDLFVKGNLAPPGAAVINCHFSIPHISIEVVGHRGRVVDPPEPGACQQWHSNGDETKDFRILVVQSVTNRTSGFRSFAEELHFPILDRLFALHGFIFKDKGRKYGAVIKADHNAWYRILDGKAVAVNPDHMAIKYLGSIIMYFYVSKVTYGHNDVLQLRIPDSLQSELGDVYMDLNVASSSNDKE